MIWNQKIGISLCCLTLCISSTHLYAYLETSRVYYCITFISITRSPKSNFLFCITRHNVQWGSGYWLVCYWNGPREVGSLMVRFLNAIWIPDSPTIWIPDKSWFLMYWSGNPMVGLVQKTKTGHLNTEPQKVQYSWSVFRSPLYINNNLFWGWLICHKVLKFTIQFTECVERILKAPQITFCDTFNAPFMIIHWGSEYQNSLVFKLW